MLVRLVRATVQLLGLICGGGGGGGGGGDDVETPPFSGSGVGAGFTTLLHWGCTRKLRAGLVKHDDDDDVAGDEDAFLLGLILLTKDF